MKPKNNRNLTASPFRNSPWLIAVAIFVSVSTLLAPVLQLLTVYAPFPPTKVGTYLQWLLGCMGTLELLAAGIIVAMLARGKERTATILLGFGLALFPLAADVTVASLTHRHSLFLAHPILLIANAMMVVSAGVLVRKIRLKAERQRSPA